MDTIMKKTLISILLAFLGVIQVEAFCGFYVAKADATLFNKASQVILVRNGNRSSITMFSDYSGPVKEFAMVVPVPVVLTRSQIKTVHKSVFQKIDVYTGPRLVEYHDQSPCYRPDYEEISMSSVETVSDDWQSPERDKRKTENRVTIEARYEVDEYEILILSAKESSGLESWLTENGYRLPVGAAEVLEPYIKNEMKFFVAKVNLKKFDPNGKNELNPLQISFDSPKFALPIRLGMANSSGDQDLIVYAFTRNGRVETVNYRTAQMPTNRNIPEFISPSFGPFYADVFNKSWNREEKTAVMLEYAWNISGQAPMKCDPCPETENGPLTSLGYQTLLDLGVDWISAQDLGNNLNFGGGTDYDGPLFITRLHARYNRVLYPQDLVFQETANRENFQCRYVMNHPSQDLDCEEAQTYLKDLVGRRQKELMEMNYLAGWDPNRYPDYNRKYMAMIKDNKNGNKNFIPIFPISPGGGTPPALILLVALFLFATFFILRIPSKVTQ